MEPTIEELSKTEPAENVDIEIRAGPEGSRLYASRKAKLCVYHPDHAVRQRDGYCFECGAFTGWEVGV